MRFDILTLFPDLFASFLQEGVLRRAIEMGHVEVRLHNIRDYATGKHRVTDDYPYGGGGGMIMKPEPIFRAVEAILSDVPESGAPVPIILLSPQGRTFTQAIAFELAKQPRLVLICGRYEGVDERVRLYLATDEISIGDYVLSGGELPAMVVVEAVTRLLPGVLGDPLGPRRDSFAVGLLEHPQYTRPPDFRGYRVPEVLLSGDHAEIARWRRQESLRRTWQRRPELLQHVELSEEDRRFLSSLEQEQGKLINSTDNGKENR